jgi:hypothetical protein
MSAAVSIGIFIVFLIGCLIIYGKDFMDYIERLKAYDKLKTNTISEDQRKSFNNKLDKYLEQLIIATNTQKLDVIKLKQLTVLLFVLSFMIVSYVLGLFAGLLVSIMVASLPFISLRLRLNTMQTKGSHEGESLIVNLLSKYRTSSFNIEEAIEKVVKDSDISIPNCQVALYRLLYSARGTKNPVLIRESTNLFAYTLGTNWAKMLSNNIYLAIVSGTNVSKPLEDILIRLRGASILQEERRRKNAESIRIVKYVAPTIYIFFFLIAVNFVGISPKTYMYNQFMTKQGMVLFIACIVSWMFNYILILSIKNKKFDF